MEKYGLESFPYDLYNIEHQYLNLIYHPLFGKVVTRNEYDSTREMMMWNCAICGKPIMVNKRKYDVENFVCDKCSELYNNRNTMVDRRILDSRTKLYKFLEDSLYRQLEDSIMKGGGGQ